MSIKYESVKSSRVLKLKFCSLLLVNDKTSSNYLSRAYLERGVKGYITPTPISTGFLSYS